MVYDAPREEDIPNAASFEPNRTYRYIVIALNDYDADDTDNYKVLECNYCDTFWDARISSQQYADGCYAIVERSIDGGVTWHRYNGREWIGRAPAWTYRDI